MASPPPAYETTTSPDASSVNTHQNTHLWPTPTALLPSYSTSSPSCWMKEEALEILRTSHNFDTIRLICNFAPGLDRAVAVTLLSKRRKGWLDAFLKILYRRQAGPEPSCDSPLSTAEAIVDIIRWRRLSPVPEWNGAWIFSALNSSRDISIIAEKFITQIDSVFSRITFEDWVEWAHGFPNDPVQGLLNTGFNLRNDLARSVQEHAIIVDRLQLLQEVLPSRHPLPHWIVSTAIASDTMSEPSEALPFFVDPIKQLDKEQSSGILSVVQRLSILSTRYEMHITFATDIKWLKPFSTDFLLWESISTNSPLDMAKSNTKSVSKLYRGLAAEDVLDDSEYMQDIQRRWSDSSIDILACLIVNENLLVYFTELAKHLLDLDLRNVYFAAAIGSALEKWRYQPQTAEQSRVWNIINPKDNYAGCRKYMAENSPCLPFFPPCILELRQSNNASSKIMEIFQFLGYFGRRKEDAEQDVEKQVVREGAIVNRYSPNYPPSFSPTRRPKRKAVQDLNLENSQRNNLNIKRRKVDDNPYILQSPLILESTTGGSKEIWVIHGATALKGQFEFESQQNLNMCADTMAYYIAFREEKADEIRALCIKKNCQIFKEACQQMERMLLGIADAPTVALEILCGLTRIQIVLLSCTTIVERQYFLNVTQSINSRDWTDEEIHAFVCKFTTYVAGPWDRERILNDWEKLGKFLFHEVWERRLGRPPASRGYPSIWAGVEIWSKLDRLPRETEILRLEL